MKTVLTFLVCVIAVLPIAFESSSAIDEPEMVFINGGSFLMGCTDTSVGCNSDEYPVVSVLLDDFRIGRYEVTNDQFADFLTAEGNRSEGGEAWYKMDQYSLITESEEGEFNAVAGFGSYPANNVSWYGAKAYAEWLSQVTSNNYRLPTEAEWEYASRGGQKSKGFVYSGSDLPEEVAWFSDFAAGSETQWGFKNDKGSREVGQKNPNELGLYDMSGNVSEWCLNNYENYLTGGINPAGVPYGSLKVKRGGSWDNSESGIHNSARNYAQHISSFPVNTGFRIVMVNTNQ